ncbi:MAG: DUF58 domain-containing protein [Anaerolineae bacterium]|nr:DUF58 domain-containing protein [Anaerolineae bacterium]
MSRITIDHSKETQFSEAWVALAIMLTVVGLVFRLKGLMTVAALLLTIVPIAWLWNKYTLRGLHYERLLSERRAFPDETLELTLRVSNWKLLPVGWLQIEDQFPLGVPLLDEELLTSQSSNVGHLVTAFSLRWYQRVSRRYRLHCPRRGFYRFGPAHLKSGDLFGLFSQEGWQKKDDWLIVYPKVVPITELGLLSKEPFGETKARQRIFEDPMRAIGVRDHQPGDSFKHIHWKATARQQRLQTRVYEPTTSYNLIVFLNVATFPKHWQGTDPALLEKAISVAASIASYGVEQRYIVGVIANGSVPHSDQSIKVLPSRDPKQLASILEALAAVTSFATSSIEDLLMTESPKLPWGATLVIVTAIVSEELAATLLRLRDVGRRLVLISLDQEPPGQELEGILSYHLPGVEIDFRPPSKRGEMRGEFVQGRQAVETFTRLGG